MPQYLKDGRYSSSLMGLERKIKLSFFLRYVILQASINKKIYTIFPQFCDLQRAFQWRFGSWNVQLSVCTLPFTQVAPCSSLFYLLSHCLQSITIIHTGLNFEQSQLRHLSTPDFMNGTQIYASQLLQAYNFYWNVPKRLFPYK